MQPTVGIRKPTGAFGGGLISDIQLNRGDELLIRDRERQDQDDKIVEQANTIRNLQAHVGYLERQLARAVQLNPALNDELSTTPPLGAGEATEAAAAGAGGNTEDHSSVLANMIQNSTLLKSYEQLMQNYEKDYEKKSKLIQQLERDQQQLLHENNAMSDQLYQLRSKVSAADDGENDGGAGLNRQDLEKNDKMQKDKMVELLKRNHDVMMEKYELYRQRNEVLEKRALDKEALYLKIKSENDHVADSLYEAQRQAENLRQENLLLDSKLKSSETFLKETTEQANSTRIAKEQLESQVKMVTEQLELLQKSHEQLSSKKQNETELMSKEINMLGVKDRDIKNRVIVLENELAETKDHARVAMQELDVRTKENDHLVSLLEDQEQRIALYEEKEKSIHALANESKKRIEDANLERDRVLLKEQQYLSKITRLEDQLKQEATDRQERHERVVESLRQKHSSMMEQKSNEIADLSRKLSEAVEQSERNRMDRDSLRQEVTKLQDQWRTFKEDTSMKYESYNKQLNQQEAMSDEKLRGVQRENEKLKEELESLKNERQAAQINQHEQEVKLDSYMRDYERYFDDNKRLRELINQLRDEKESALSEVNRLKIVFNGRINELNDEYNVKIAHLENTLLEAKERHKGYEERAYTVMIHQEKITEKWKGEHKNTVEYYDRQLRQVQLENRHLSDKVVELKGQIRASRGDTVFDKPTMMGTDHQSKKSSKSRERK